MAFYIDLRAINELVGSKNYRAEKIFTIEELSRYDGSNGKPAYIAVNGIVYDVSKEPTWEGAEHFNMKAGTDLTEQFNSCHGEVELLHNLPMVGMLIDGDNNNSEGETRNILEATYAFSPDDWIKYLTPIIDKAVDEASLEPNIEHVFQKYMLATVLVAQGRTTDDAINLVKQWENTGLSKLLEQSNTKPVGILQVNLSSKKV